MSTEVIVVHVGQAGSQMGNTFWQLACIEYGVSPDGYYMEENNKDSLKSIFQDVQSGKVIPRVIFVDTEPTVIDEIRTGAYKRLYHPKQLISLKEDSANNFARGSFSIGQLCIKPFIAIFSKLVEEVDHLASILFFNSIGGGTGSGTAALLLQQITIDYAKSFKYQVCVHPSATMNNAIVEPYNALFHTHSSLEGIDMSMIFDNEAFYEISQRILLTTSPTFSDINRLISMVVNSLTPSKCEEGSMHLDLREINTNLVPFPRIHYCLVSYAPLYCNLGLDDKTLTLEEITKDVFSKYNQTIKCDLAQGQYVSAMLSYRGTICLNEVSSIVSKYKKTHMQFVEWCPTGIKMSVNQRCLTRLPVSEIGYSDKAVTMLCNNTAVKSLWLRLTNKFETLFYKRAFIHWYFNEGMEQDEFTETLMDIKLLVDDYEEISLTEAEILDILDKYPDGRSQSLSIRA